MSAIILAGSLALLLTWQTTYSMEVGNQLNQGANNESPLIQVIKSQNAELKKIMSLVKADNKIVDDQDMQGRTALALAIPIGGASKIISFLLDSGADINKADNEGTTPLMVATSSGGEDDMEYLIAKKAKINASDCNGNTALLRTISNNSSRIKRAMILVRNGADIERANNKGITPLMVAVSHNEGPLLVRRLITLGVNVLVKDNEGKTALMHAEEKNARPIIIKYLCKAEREQRLMIKDVKK